MNLNVTKLSRICKSFYKKYEQQIKDIILFGSALRGKEKPSDIDILVLFRDSVDKDTEYELKKQLSKSFKDISLVSKTEKSLQDKSFTAREAILFEGYSLITKEYISSKYGFSSFGLFVYQTKDLKNTEKTKFYYALNGRGSNEGMLDILNAIRISDNIISVPLKEIEGTKDFFSHWNIEFTYIPSLIPSRLSKKHILGNVR